MWRIGEACGQCILLRSKRKYVAVNVSLHINVKVEGRVFDFQNCLCVVTITCTWFLTVTDDIYLRFEEKNLQLIVTRKTYRVCWNHTRSLFSMYFINVEMFLCSPAVLCYFANIFLTKRVSQFTKRWSDWFCFLWNVSYNTAVLCYFAKHVSKLVQCFFLYNTWN